MRQVKHLLADKGSLVHSVPPSTPVIDAVRAMAEHHIGALLVIADGRLVGIVSERDYARKVVLMGRSSSATSVADIMTAEVVTVASGDSVDHCMRMCTERRVRHLPVVDAGRVNGVLSIGDLVKAVISEQSEQIEYLQRYIAG